MTLEERKEALSMRFVQTLANRAGHKSERPPGTDNGVDLEIGENEVFTVGGKNIYTSTGKIIHLQLKASSESSSLITENNPTSFKYKFKVKHYNKIVRRLQTGSSVPFLLIVFVLPEKENKWISHDNDGLLIRKEAFWYKPDTTDFSLNKETITITIRKSNRVDFKFFNSIFTAFTI